MTSLVLLQTQRRTDIVYLACCNESELDELVERLRRDLYDHQVEVVAVFPRRGDALAQAQDALKGNFEIGQNAVEEARLNALGGCSGDAGLCQWRENYKIDNAEERTQRAIIGAYQGDDGWFYMPAGAALQKLGACLALEPVGWSCAVATQPPVAKLCLFDRQQLDSTVYLLATFAARHSGADCATWFAAQQERMGQWHECTKQSPPTTEPTKPTEPTKHDDAPTCGPTEPAKLSRTTATTEQEWPNDPFAQKTSFAPQAKPLRRGGSRMRNATPLPLEPIEENHLNDDAELVNPYGDDDELLGCAKRKIKPDVCIRQAKPVADPTKKNEIPTNETRKQVVTPPGGHGQDTIATRPQEQLEAARQQAEEMLDERPEMQATPASPQNKEHFAAIAAATLGGLGVVETCNKQEPKAPSQQAECAKLVTCAKEEADVATTLKRNMQQKLGVDVAAAMLGQYQQKVLRDPQGKCQRYFVDAAGLTVRLVLQMPSVTK
jgi:hypothetical protein